MNQQERETNYPFDWMDETVEVTLNPEVSQIQDLDDEQFRALLQHFEQESISILKRLKHLTFALRTPEHVRVVAEQCDTAIGLLQLQAENNLKSYLENEQLMSLGTSIIGNLKMLRSKLQIRYVSFLNEAPSLQKKELQNGSSSIPKLTCMLTVDQIGLILKAADESRLIVSSSLSIIFKAIVPYLSTGMKKELSWDSMRSNSYHPEEKDKKAAIAALEKLINKIKEE